MSPPYRQQLTCQYTQEGFFSVGGRTLLSVEK